MRHGSALRGRVSARGRQLRQTLLNRAGKVLLPHLLEVTHLARGNNRRVQVAHLRDVRKQLSRSWCDTVRAIRVAQQQGGHGLEKILQIAEKQVVFVAIVRVKRRASDVRAIKHLLDCDGVERLLLDQREQCIAQRVAGAANPAVDFRSRSVAFRDTQPCFVRYRPLRRKCGLTALLPAAKVQPMTDNQVSGLALIAGSVGSIITMSLHPSGNRA